MVSGGVFLGAPMLLAAFTSNPGRKSATVGTSGSTFERAVDLDRPNASMTVAFIEISRCADNQQSHDRQQQRRNHHNGPESKKVPGADVLSFSPESRQPKDRCERACDRQVRSEIDTD